MRIGIEERALASGGAASPVGFGGGALRSARHKSRRWENHHLAESTPGAGSREPRASRAEAARKRALQARPSKNVSRSSLPPDVLAGRNRIEDAIPSRLEVKRRHGEEEHGVVPAPAWSQKLPPIRPLIPVALIQLGCLHRFEFLGLAGKDEKAHEAEQRPQDRTHEDKPGRKTPFMLHICI
jgi:hypothetical protein